MTRAAWAVSLSLSLVFGFASDVPPQCDQAVFRRNNPGLCDVFPFPNLPPVGGGGNDGGILGTIGRVLHDLGL